MLSYTFKILRALIARRISLSVDMIPFKLHGLTLKKTLNWILTEGSVFFKPSKPWGYPTLLHLEPTTKCNLTCRTCPITHGLNRSTGNMDLLLFKKVIDDLYKYLLLILLWDWGEPFLNPQIYDMIKYARKRGVKLLSSTNGHIFAKPSHARRIVASGLDALVFSVDGITQKTYQYYRAGGNLESVVEGIRNVVAEKRNQKSQTPLLNFRFIVMKHNEYQVPRVEKFARALGVDLLTFRKFFAVVNEEDGLNRQAFLEPSDSRYYRFNRSNAVPDPVKIKKNPCKNLWNCPAIHWNGDVCSCTCDYEGSHVFGNVNKKSFRAIWFGQSANRMRRDFKEFWRGIPLCKDCCYAFEGGDMGRDSISKAVFFND